MKKNYATTRSFLAAMAAIVLATLALAGPALAANFAPLTQGRHAVNVGVSPAGGGTAAPSATEAAEGETVTLTAASDQGFRFVSWTPPDGVTLTDRYSANTTFTMPGKSVTVTANFARLPANRYAVNVEADPPNFGTADASKIGAAEGDVVAILASPSGGYKFTGWESSDGVTFGNAKSPSTTFTMPGKNVTVTARFAAMSPPSKWPVTMGASPNTGGTAIASQAMAFEGEVVTILASPKEGFTFTEWTSAPAVTFDDPDSASTTFIMPDGSVTVTANFEAASPPTPPTPTLYDVRANAGTGGTAVASPAKAAEGDVVTILASPKDGYAFTGWTTSDGVTFGNAKSASTTFRMPGHDVTVTANFKSLAENSHAVYVGASPMGGGTAASDKTEAASGDVVALTAASDPGFRFVSWMATPGVTVADRSSPNTTFTMPSQNVTVTANFAPLNTGSHAVNVGVSPEGGGTAAPDKTEARSGETVTLTAASDPRFRFVSWTAPAGVTLAVPTSPNTTFTMPDQDVTVTANFERLMTIHAVNVGVDPLSGGTAASSATEAVSGELVTLTASPNDGCTFTGWTSPNTAVTFGNAQNVITSFTMPDSDVTVTATFTRAPTPPTPPTLSNVVMEVLPAGCGTAIASRAKAAEGDVVMILASPGDNYVFTGWTGSDVTLENAKSATTTFIMPNKSVKVTANFESASPPTPGLYDVEMYAEPDETCGTALASHERAAEGDVVTILASPKDNYVFTGWTGSNGVTLGNEKSATTTFTMPGRDVTVKAYFASLQSDEHAVYASVNPLGGGTAAPSVPQAALDETVSLTASAHPGFRFVSWTAPPDVTLADRSSPNTTFTMLDHDVSVTANFAPLSSPNHHAVNVGVSPADGGTAAPSVAEAKLGETVSLTAASDPGFRFERWTAPGVTLAALDSPNTTFTMPNENVTVTANFAPLSSPNHHAVNVGVDPLGGGTASADMSEAPQGETVTLTATAHPGFLFVSWTAPANVTLADRSRPNTTFTMPDSDVSVTANFEPALYAVNAGVDPSGGGEAIASPSKAASGDVVMILASPKDGYTFTGWTTSDGVTFDDPNSASATFTMPGGKVTVTAKFTSASPPTPPPALYSVTADADMGGTAVASPAKAAEGEVVTILASPKDNNVFTGWETSDVTLGNEESASTTFTMPGKDVTVKAHFAPLTQGSHAVYVGVSPLGGGTASADETEAVKGVTVELTAAAESGFRFVSWTAPAGVTVAAPTSLNTTFTMPDRDVRVTANFKRSANSHAVNVGVSPRGGGTATPDKTEATEGETVSLKASANPGFRFVDWTAPAGATLEAPNSPNTTFTMPDSAVTVTANFERLIPYALNVGVSPAGGGTASADVRETTGGATVIWLSATPNAGYRFKEWQAVTPADLMIDSTTSATASFEMPVEDVTVRAMFIASGGGGPTPDPGPTPTPTPGPGPDDGGPDEEDDDPNEPFIEVTITIIEGGDGKPVAIFGLTAGGVPLAGMDLWAWLVPTDGSEELGAFLGTTDIEGRLVLDVDDLVWADGDHAGEKATVPAGTWRIRVALIDEATGKRYAGLSIGVVTLPATSDEDDQDDDHEEGDDPNDGDRKGTGKGGCDVVSLGALMMMAGAAFVLKRKG